MAHTSTNTRLTRVYTLDATIMSEEDYMSLAEREDDDDDEEYQPQSSLLSPDPASFPNQPPKKRGRKPNPNPSIRSAREAARKANHSVIEKKRREKINGALAELRALVPSYDDESTAPSTSKDFKLEVLVRTVKHLKHLNTRVQELEQDLASGSNQVPSRCCAHCARRTINEPRRHSHVELPPLSDLLSGLPSPPASGSLTTMSPTIDIPNLQLPAATVPLDDRHTQRHMHEQAAYLLLHMSGRESEDNVNRPNRTETPKRLLGM